MEGPEFRSLSENSSDKESETQNNISPKAPWDMTEEEFLESAARGRGRGIEDENVLDVCERTKPVAVISYPDSMETAAMRLLRKPEIIERIDLKLFTHPGSTRTVAIIVPKGSDLQKMVDRYVGFYYNIKDGKLVLKEGLRETPRSVVEEGNFYGYSPDDINYYLNNEFGYDKVIKEGRSTE